MRDYLVNVVRRWWEELRRFWRRPPARPKPVAAKRKAADTPRVYRPLQTLVLTDGVSHTLFEEYAEHRQSLRGDEETGWVLLGHRHEEEAVALATLPAGMECEAGVAHVKFNSAAQALASRIVRQNDRQLTILGVVHTHPGSLRHPSSGDYRGDREWVKYLRGGEGVFAIGTAEGKDGADPWIADQPERHSQSYWGLQFTWYALAGGDKQYRKLPIRLTIGPDLARPLHLIWSIIETHAEALERLIRQLKEVRFEVVEKDKESALHVQIPLGSGEEALCVILNKDDARYCLIRQGEWQVSDHHELPVDRGVFRILAETT